MLGICLKPPILTNSLTVTAVVGTFLNAINQGDILFGGGDVNWTKVCLTYAVPFLVATYSAWRALSGSKK